MSAAVLSGGILLTTAAAGEIDPEDYPPPPEIGAGGECVGSVPYLDYSIDDELFDDPVPDGGLTITFEHPGDPSRNHVVSGLDGSGLVLWPGAEVDSEGNGTDWPGWIFEDGSWVPGDDGFEWVRPQVTVVFSWNPDVATVVEYPEAGGECNPPGGDGDAASPDDPADEDDPPSARGEIPSTGADVTLAVAGGGLLLGGIALMLLGRYRRRSSL